MIPLEATITIYKIKIMKINLDNITNLTYQMQNMIAICF